MPEAVSETFLDLVFPLGGMDRSRAFGDPRPQTFPEGQAAFTTISGINVRAADADQFRLRGGSRVGLSKYVAEAVVAGWMIQGLGQILVVDPDVVQLSQSGRVVILVAVCQGSVFTAEAGAEEWTEVPLDTGVSSPPLAFSGIVRSAVNGQKMYFADGANWRLYDPDANEVQTWTASAGTLPVDGDGNKPRLICTWRGRTVLSGILGDPQNIFMSAVGDPTDFDYFPADITATQAVAINLAPLGLVGDTVTALIPFSDDVLVVGCDHSIWSVTGDPMAGGKVDNISDTVGIAWGEAFARSPDGTLYFMSNLTGIYAMPKGQLPIRISQQVEHFLSQINTGINGIRLVWNDRLQGLHVWITFLSFPAPCVHLFWEARTNAWWQDTFADDDFNPLASCLFDGNRPQDRTVLIGSWDGYVRAVDVDATDDDGKEIASSVVLGPLVTKNLDELMVKDLQAVLGETSGEVSYEVYVGKTAEEALSRTPVTRGTWRAGRNPLSFVRFAGHALFVRLTSTDRWAMEQIRCRMAGTGAVRRRSVY